MNCFISIGNLSFPSSSWVRALINCECPILLMLVKFCFYCSCITVLVALKEASLSITTWQGKTKRKYIKWGKKHFWNKIMLKRSTPRKTLFTTSDLKNLCTKNLKEIFFTKKKSSFKRKNPYLQQSFAKKIDTKPSMHLESRKHISKLVDLETHSDELWSWSSNA